MNTLAERLREERLRVGLTQQDLARIGGVSKNTQWNFEVGKSHPMADYLARIAQAGVDVCFVLIGVRSLRIGRETDYSIALFNELLDDYSELPDEFRLQVNATATALLHGCVKRGQAKGMRLREPSSDAHAGANTLSEKITDPELPERRSSPRRRRRGPIG